MKKKLLTGAILILMAGIGIFGLVKYQFQGTQRQSVESISDNSEKDAAEEGEDSEGKLTSAAPASDKAVLDNKIIYNNARYADQKEITPSDSNVYQIGDIFDTKGVLYTVNNYQVTKNKGDFDISDIKETPLDVEFDNEDNITNNYSYVVIDVTIKNKESKEIEFYMNNLWLRLINKESVYSNADIYYGGQLRGYADGQTADIGKSYFRRIFGIEEERQCRLTYVISDEELEGAVLLLKIWPSGAINYEDDSRFVQLVQENE